MPTHFDLIITADYPSCTAEFTLRDSAGVQLAYRRTEFGNISASHQQGLFDLHNYLYFLVDKGNERAAVAGIGVCIAEEVLGQEIFEQLYASHSQRNLRIQLPGAGETENFLASALARVPWEIARPKADAETLSERNLLVRVVHDMETPASTPIELAADEPLRVLFIFAEARGSCPLGARKERRELLRLFEKEIYPQRRIVAHFLTHGVTRQRLHSQIQEHGGYHVVHWSGHGNINLLELCKPGGAGDHLSGQELLGIFNDAGGFLPRLFFLSACHSGDILRVKDWNDFVAVAQGQKPEKKDAAARDLDLKVRPGYTGTAHALLQGGVPSVVAMRYAVGDDYARDVAVEFYRALLAHALPKTVSAALTMARHAILDGTKYDSTRFGVCDHATSVLYGEEHLGLPLMKGRSPDLNPRNSRLHDISELTTEGHEHFVGRTWELVGLGADFIGSGTGTEVKPVAVITGLGGMGKTALTAEALALWETRFQWVLIYQAKPNALGFDATLRDIHIKLMGELKHYENHVRENPAHAIYRAATAEFTGPMRLERLTRNLLRALKDEPILIVLDNFETNLKQYAESASVAGGAVWSCQDPEWDRCLTLLSAELKGSPSRLLITCRRQLAVLADGAAHHVLLGPLPGAEAALFLNEHPTLSSMVFGGDASEMALAFRLLNASRFHPLLMDRLAKLAADVAFRPQLLAALDSLEKTKDFAQLPALFSTTPGDAKELAYLDDALASSLDQLIRDSNPDARRLLWMIAIANQPEVFALVEGVWSGKSQKQTKLRAMKRDLGRFHELPPDHQAYLNSLSTELHAMIDALPAEELVRPDIAPLLCYLVSVGLVTEEREGPEDKNPNLTCHELVRERICARMVQHPKDREELSENGIRLAYAEQLEEVYYALQHQNMTAALSAGSRSVVYCVQAGDWDRLSRLASSLITGTNNPEILDSLLPHLEAASDSAPAGRARWSLLNTLATALSRRGLNSMSLSVFERAAHFCHAAALESIGGGSLVWADLGLILSAWAFAARDSGNLDLAFSLQSRCIDAEKNARRGPVIVSMYELELFRIQIIQGSAAEILPHIANQLAKIQAWWQASKNGLPVPGSPEVELIGRALIGAYDIAQQAHAAEKQWAPALTHIESGLAIQLELHRADEDIVRTRINRANVLARLDRLWVAKHELETCLEQVNNNESTKATILSALASVFSRLNDAPQAITQERRALALREQLSDPAGCAISHNNLANYLEEIGSPTALSESSRHQMASLLYRLVAGLGQHLQTTSNNYYARFRNAHAAGTALTLPRVAELLADPAFAPLEQWLSQDRADAEELQAAVDQFLSQARQAALSRT
jgi:hypothetical protein